VTERRYPSRQWGGFYLLPQPKRANPLWGLASVVVHAVVVVLLVSVAGPTFLTEEQPAEVTTLITLLPPGWVDDRQFAMPALGGGEGEEGGEPEEEGPPDRAAPGPAVDSVIPPPETDVAMIIGTETGEGDSIAAPGAIGPRRLIRPAFGDGRLWVRTRDAALGVVGPSETVEMHVARVDSAIRQRIRAYIDTMPPDSFATAPPPNWTVDVGEDTWGMDGSWIYLGDFKIPNILLALIPVPQGNIPMAEDAAELARIRADIIQAAERAENADQFKEYVNAVRRRKQAERDSLRALRERREGRDSIVPRPIPP
jgi:hypothetical protein